jgi:transcriptional regulator with XRE-family HTH domain
MNMHTRQLGSLIRELRKKRGLTGIALSQQAGMSQSKLSKLETGSLPQPTADDVSHVLNILEAPQTILQQAMALLEEPTTHGFMRITSTFDTDCLSKEKESKQIRIFCTSVVPSLLHTTDFHLSIHNLNGDGDLMQATRALHMRQELLWQETRAYHLLMLEAALYTPFVERKVMLGQLDRLQQSLGIPRLRIGILPTTAGLPTLDLGSFGIYDDRLVIDALQHREMTSDNKNDIRIYQDTFNDLEHLAHFDDDAAAIIKKASDHLR